MYDTLEGKCMFMVSGYEDWCLLFIMVIIVSVSVINIFSSFTSNDP